MKTAAVVAWSGNGALEDLERTAASKLGMPRESVRKGPTSLILEHADPVKVASGLSHLPGVSWIAVGYEFLGWKQCESALHRLAGKYLSEGSSFRLTARVEESEGTEGDLLLDGNGTILKSVKNSRVDEKNPDVTFRIVMVRDKGAVGVELRRGHGGVPTSNARRAFCLVSGGYHSAVVAWMAALSGYEVTLVHSRSEDEPLRQVARLYAELSRRMDASGLELLLLDGDGPVGGRLDAWLPKAKGEVMAGGHPECRGEDVRRTFRRHPSVIQPLLLLQEDEVRARYESLGLKVKAVDTKAMLSLGRSASYSVKRFGGKEADISGVLDSILSTRAH